MDNNALQVFNNQQLDFTLRSITDEHGVIWFVAKDIAQGLEYSYWQPNIVAHVPEIWKGIKPINTPGGEQEMLCLTEQGVYFFLGRSDKPKALPYQMWIAGDVVPSIRKHGAYLTPKAQEEIINDPDFIIKLAQALKDEKAKSAALQEQAEKDNPLVVFAQAVDTSADSILIGNLAKLLRQKGIDIGSTRLFAWLRENNFLIKQRGELWNMPTQSSMDKGLFEVKTRIINAPDGHSKIVHTTKVTGKGQIFFVNFFLDKANAEKLRG